MRAPPFAYAALLCLWFESNAALAELRIGQDLIGLSSVGGSALCLTVDRNGGKSGDPSIYLANDLTQDPTVATRIEDGWTKLDAVFGQLAVSPSGEWWLKDRPGGTLLARGTILPAEVATEGDPKIEIQVMPAGGTSELYGGGNGVDHLRQVEGRSRVGNGIAVEPYGWSDSGFAELAIGSDDNRPPTWRSDPAHRAQSWTFAGSRARLYLMPARDLHAAAAAYSKLSGKGRVPPRWTFGYLQSRWGWQDRAYLDDTRHQFRQRALPVDGFIIDFEWYTPEPDYEVPPAGLPNFPDFGWNARLFPDPQRQLADLRQDGIRFIGIRKPRLGDQDRLIMARNNGWILTKQIRSNHAKAYDARDLDFAQPAVRAWYAQQLQPLLKSGVAGWWNDEGEGTFTNYYWWNKAEDDALQAARPHERLWTLNRAFSPGLQRFGAAAWTGDIKSTWTVLRETPTALLNWSLAGMPYGACDIGGFIGQETPELLTRWMEAGVFFPVMRAHSSIHTENPRFPWLYGSEAERAIRDALTLRYRLIPYYYSLAHHYWQSGLPLMRPLAMEFPDDPEVKDLSDEWLMGPGLLAAPVLTPDSQRSIYLPVGTWYPLDSNKPVAGARRFIRPVPINQIPVYVRAGTILPMAAGLQTTDAHPLGDLQLHVYPGANGTFVLVEDDGLTDAYAGGLVRKTIFQWDDPQATLTWTQEGAYAGSDTYPTVVVTVWSPQGVLKQTARLDRAGQLRFENQPTPR